MMSICLTWFPISGLGEPEKYHQWVCFKRIWEDCGILLCKRIDGCRVVSGTCPTCVIDKVWE